MPPETRVLYLQREDKNITLISPLLLVTMGILGSPKRMWIHQSAAVVLNLESWTFTVVHSARQDITHHLNRSGPRFSMMKQSISMLTGLQATQMNGVLSGISGKMTVLTSMKAICEQSWLPHSLIPPPVSSRSTQRPIPGLHQADAEIKSNTKYGNEAVVRPCLYMIKSLNTKGLGLQSRVFQQAFRHLWGRPTAHIYYFSVWDHLNAYTRAFCRFKRCRRTFQPPHTRLQWI